MADKGERYYLRRWVEVTKAEYVAAEQEFGFFNTMGKPDEPATAAFGTSGVDEVEGKTTWESTRVMPKHRGSKRHRPKMAEWLDTGEIEGHRL
jgi:hypothetical protein